MKKVLFIDRDGTLIRESPPDFQVDSLEKLEFMPGVFRCLYRIRHDLDFELVIVSNQDGMGTPAFPERDFMKVQDKMLRAFENEGIFFDKILIDRSLPEDNAPTRKPGTGMLVSYTGGDYDLAKSFVIGDRITDAELARNLGCQCILLANPSLQEQLEKEGLANSGILVTDSWEKVYERLALDIRKAVVERNTAETRIRVSLNADGNGTYNVHTGLGFFDHLLCQLAKHSGMDMTVDVKGDLEVDEHHTIEDTALALGEALHAALGSKRGMERYGFALPMDDCMAQVLIDFGGRPWLVWDANFRREKIGDMPTEMFMHFFRSFSDAAHCNLNIKAEGDNEHHKIEAIFKATAKAIRMAIVRNPWNNTLPTTKGAL